MKKIYLVLILVLSQNVFCQDYVFDKFIEYSEIGRASVVFMFNSKDSTYFFYAKNFGSDLEGSVIDEGTKMRHLYKMENPKKEIDFIYVNSSPSLPSNHSCYPDAIYETKQILFDSVPTFEIRRLNKNRKQVVLATVTAKTAPENLNCFSRIMEHLFNHFVCCHQLDLPNNYMPYVAEIKYNNGKTVKTKLVQTKNTNTQLTIKQGQLKLKSNDD